MKTKVNLKLVVKRTEKQIQYAPTYTGEVTLEGINYKISLYQNLNQVTLVLDDELPTTAFNKKLT